MAARQLIQARPATPPKTGLMPSFAASTPMNPDGTPARWEDGITFTPELCEGGARSNINCVGDTVARTPQAQPGPVSWDPFLVWSADQCSTLGSIEREQESRALRALNACRSQQIANELWTGELAKEATPDLPNLYLAHPDSLVVSPGTGLAALDALACLEQGLAECSCGQQGVIHATRQIVTLWQAGGALRREGSVILTVNDTIVVGDAGYDGSDPDGNPASAGNIWAYATGPITIHLGEVFPTTAIDPMANTRTVWQNQLAMAYFTPCCHWAVQIDADPCSLDDTGS